ncbi:MAG: TonB-dependent receptor, partial [Bacteroidota bacterium]
MNNKVQLLPTLFTIFFPILLSGQFAVSGTVSADGAPLPYAEVMLLDTLNQLIKGDLSDLDGRFTLAAPAGRYHLRVNYLGYEAEAVVLELVENQDLGTITLSNQGEDLAAVTVTATRPLIEQRPDRLIFNLESSIAAAGGTGLSALELVPGIRLQNGLLELIGRGNPAVLLDGRLLQLTGEELTSFLASLAADDIQRIEVIANPPARYAAAGQGGLLNIVLKKGRSNAWKNTTTLSHTQAFYGFTNLNNAFFFNREKLSLSASATATKGFQRDFEEIEVQFPSANWATEVVNRSRNDRYSARLAADYSFSDQFSLGAQYLGNFSQPNFDGTATGAVRNQNNQLDSLLINQQLADRNVTSHTANLHGNWQLDTNGRSISFDLDLFDYDNELTQFSDIATFSPEETFLGINLAQENRSDQRITNYSAKIDVEQPFLSFQLSYGASLMYTSTLADQRNFNTRSGMPVFDASLSNEFEYEENVQAAYFTAKGDGGDRWQWQAGLRVENTQTESFSLTLNQRTPNDYFKLFPTLYLVYRPAEDQEFSFSYGRRINRPGFRNLNPFRIYANSNSYSEGNPFLQPSFTDRFEFTHAFRGKLRTNLFFNRTIEGHGVLFAPDAEAQIQAAIRRNYYQEYYFGIGEILTLESGIWSSQSQAYVYAGITEVLPGFLAQEQNGV